MGVDWLDAVLLYLYNNRKYCYIQEIHKAMEPILAIPIIEILVIINKLAKDGYITIEEHIIRSPDPVTQEMKEVSRRDGYFISFEGILFVENKSLIWQHRPYKWKQIKGIIKTIWEIVKIIIVVLNSVAILWLMYMAIPNK